jgi:tripartite-type tricarboxylate transporter receptor subunit TctC
VAGPANLPEEVIAKWNEGIRDMVQDPDFLAEMAAMGATASYLGPREFKAALEAEYLSARRLAEKIGIRK